MLTPLLRLAVPDDLAELARLNDVYMRETFQRPLERQRRGARP